MSRKRTVIISLVTIAAAGGAATLLRERFLATRPVTLEGAVMVRSDDVDKQVPIRDARVSVSGGLATRDVWSNASGFFDLTLTKQCKVGQPIILQFRHPEYMPLDLTVLAGDRLNEARMIPIADLSPAIVTQPRVTVSDITVRYTIKTTALINAGSVVKTFRVVNKGNVPCNRQFPCSPDGKWKAAVGSSTLEAPRGNVFSRARVSCIAGPCPFTRISSDGFSAVGSNLHVGILNWSDTTTFLFEAEVLRSMISDSERISYPAIFGQTLHFTVPAGAQGVCLEADIDHHPIVFPLGPEPRLSWASCTASPRPDHTEVYECELNPQYGFK